MNHNHNRYIVFAGFSYYPEALDDIFGVSGSSEDAQAIASAAGRCDWVVILDTLTGVEKRRLTVQVQPKVLAWEWRFKHRRGFTIPTDCPDDPERAFYWTPPNPN